jgi:hypothetical protein
MDYFERFSVWKKTKIFNKLSISPIIVIIQVVEIVYSCEMAKILRGDIIIYCVNSLPTKNFYIYSLNRM